jgi:hypothetical protein
VEHEHSAATIAKYFDGTAFDPQEAAIKKQIQKIIDWVEAHL